MEKKSLDKSNWLKPDIFKTIPMLVLWASSFFVILGFLIINLYLAQFGVYSKEFLRAEFVLTGAMFVILVAVAHVHSIILIEWFKKLYADWKGKKYLSLLGVILVLPIILIMPLPLFVAMINGGYAVAIKSLGYQVFGIVFAWFSISAFLRDTYISLNFNKSKPASEMPERLNDLLSIFLIPFLMAMFSIVLYSFFTYPHISSALGGGYRTPVTLIPTTKGIDVFKTLNLPFQENKIVGPLEVLTESEKELTILANKDTSDKRKVIRLNRELFEAIQIDVSKSDILKMKLKVETNQ